MIYLQIFVVAFFLNLLWEVLHSPLYTTCHEMPLGKMQRLLVVMSFKDAFWILFFYWMLAVMFDNTSILSNSLQLLLFIVAALSFSFVDEYISLRMQRWSYADNMPTIFGVGITPLLELAVTGVATFVIVFILL